MRGGKEEQFHVRRITMGAQNHCVGRRKGPTISQVLSSVQYICFQTTSGSNMGVPNSKLAYCPGRHLTLFCPWHWAQIEVQEIVHEDFNFCQINFAPPVKVAPMARAIPAVP